MSSSLIGQTPACPKDAGVAVESGSFGSQPSRTVRSLIVVARDRPEVWQALTHCFAADERVRVFFDRREGPRRRLDQPNTPDKGRPDRRRPQSIENDVRYRQYVIFRAREERP